MIARNDRCSRNLLCSALTRGASVASAGASLAGGNRSALTRFDATSLIIRRAWCWEPVDDA